MKRRIAIVTGTRAEYGLLHWLIRELADRGADVQLIVTGTHLSKVHGYTVEQIEADGIPIAARVDMQLSGDSPLEIAQAMGRCTSGVAVAFATLAPDMVVLLGDRYEILAAASAATVMGIPIAHLHGGEITEGAIDESIRHALTKLSYWHFASTEAYAKRILQLGEAPERIFHCGATGIDNLARIDFLPRSALEKELGIPLQSPVLLVTYHPETHSRAEPLAQIDTVLNACSRFSGATLILTGANADAGGNAINARLATFARETPKTIFRPSYGSRLYLSLMREADVVVGNSSSGVIEAPVIGKACVNIGSRQKGRLRAPSVIDCAGDEASIHATITKALSPEFQAGLAPSSLFGMPGTVAARIANTLVHMQLPETPQKAFYDLPEA